MMQLVPGLSGFSPPSHQGHQGNPLFPESIVQITQKFFGEIGQRNPVSDETIEKEPFVFSWCTWCLGGSCSSFGRGRGLFTKAAKRGVGI
jgi:hypothetical protein